VEEKGGKPTGVEGGGVNKKGSRNMVKPLAGTVSLKAGKAAKQRRSDARGGGKMRGSQQGKSATYVGTKPPI